MRSPAVADGAERVIWLTPDQPAFTVAGQRRDLTELPPQGSFAPYPENPESDQ
jgi:hypothetical protein